MSKRRKARKLTKGDRIVVAYWKDDGETTLASREYWSDEDDALARRIDAAIKRAVKDGYKCHKEYLNHKYGVNLNGK